tara:strand:+ start:319 stop:516 length:198 start_codon:yes stop_codon:yes gene_type:complete
MRKVLINSLGWTDDERESFESYLKDLANDFECQIDVTWGVDSRMDIMVETDDERVVYLIMEEGLS